MIGAGALAPHLIEAHSAVRQIRARADLEPHPAKAAAIARRIDRPGYRAEGVTDLKAAVGEADVISAATFRDRAADQGRLAEARDPCRSRRRLSAGLARIRRRGGAGAPASSSIGGPRPSRICGDICQPIAAGLTSDAAITDTFQLARRERPARQNDDGDHALQVGRRRARGSRHRAVSLVEARLAPDGRGLPLRGRAAIACPPVFYVALAVLISAWQGYRGFRLQWLARERQDDPFLTVARWEKVLLFCLADAFFYLVCSGVRVRLALACLVVDRHRPSAAGVSIGFAGDLDFLAAARCDRRDRATALSDPARQDRARSARDRAPNRAEIADPLSSRAGSAMKTRTAPAASATTSGRPWRPIRSMAPPASTGPRGCRSRRP